MVVLSFRFIDLESDNLCRYDYVDVYSGHVNGQRLGRFCGTFKPGALVSTGNKMLLQMVSDANTAGSGFLAVFSAAHPHERGEKRSWHAVVLLTQRCWPLCITMHRQKQGETLSHPWFCVWHAVKLKGIIIFLLISKSRCHLDAFICLRRGHKSKVHVDKKTAAS